MAFTHGTRSAMRNYGCHCDDCRAGNALEAQEMRARRLAQGAFRCPVCLISYQERWRLARHRRQVGHAG